MIKCTDKRVAKIHIEACVDSLSTAIAAEKWGATRLELCRDLHLDGLTPSSDLVDKVLNSVGIPVKVMIRPRSGDFNYNTEELKLMQNSILEMREIGVNLFVTGLLTEENKVAVSALSQLIASAPGSHFTFHKAIDQVLDKIEALEMLSPYQEVKAILTSGGSTTAIGGSLTIRKMISHYSHRFEIIAAGKITGENFMEVHKLLEATSYHGKNIVPLQDIDFLK